MALEINGYDTFKAFTDFATQRISEGKSKAIASATTDVKTGALAGREVKASTTDSVRHMFNWFRSDSAKAENNVTRNIFKDAIIAMFGGESKIPPAVKKAMLMADYDKGKPLTARRIMAVKRAVDAALGRLSAAVDDVKTAAASVYRVGGAVAETVDALIVTAVKTAGDDKDLIGLLKKKKVITNILVSGEGIRTEESMLEKLAALKANVDELRAATKGNPKMFEAGLIGMATLGGRAFNKGCITAMVREASAAKLDMIRSLSASSDAGQISNAVVQYHNNATAILKKSKALLSFKSAYAEEINGTRSFIGMLMLSRCSRTKLQAIDAAFKSESATKTSWIYEHLVGGHFTKNDFDANVAEEIPYTARRLGFTLLDMSANVNESLGMEPVPVEIFEGKVDNEIVDASGEILFDIAQVAKQHIADMAEARNANRPTT